MIVVHIQRIQSTFQKYTSLYLTQHIYSNIIPLNIQISSSQPIYCSIAQKASIFETRQIVFNLQYMHLTNLPQCLLQHIPFSLKVTLPLLLYVTAAMYFAASMLCN